jgi:hypothetical protein
MPLTALRQVRKMRGGAQAHLVETDAGECYVVKFRNNPQHRRVLINEVLAAGLLDYLKIAAPKTALIHITDEFLAANPEVHLTVGTRKVPVEPGWHFGSRYPGDPARLAVYDFLPDALLAQVANLDDFRAVLVFDKWIGNADGRQSVFFRAMVQGEEGPRRAAFVASMIDHGFAFDGPAWSFSDSPLQGLYARHMVYRGVRSVEDFEPWLGQVVHFPEEVLDHALRSVPRQWLEGDEDELEGLLERLLERRRRVPDLLDACRQARQNPFPDWGRSAAR